MIKKGKTRMSWKDVRKEGREEGRKEGRTQRGKMVLIHTKCRRRLHSDQIRWSGETPQGCLVACHLINITGHTV